jgi:hypothetical protein
MALAELANLTSSPLSQLIEQDQRGQPRPAPGPTGRPIAVIVLPEDRFTPSAQGSSAPSTAQEAGLFQVTQFSTLSVAADFVRAQAALPQVAQNAVPTQAAQPAAAIAVLQSTAPAVAAATNTVTTAANAQVQLQALNTALAALGLNQADIQTLDRIASLIKDFNPLAYNSLVLQLEALAEQTAAQTAPPAANTATASTGANSNSGAFQIQELAINFSGLKGTASGGSANGNGNGQQGAGGNSVQFSAFNLQVEEVRLTLTNNNGQTVQVQAPQQNAGATIGVQQATQAKGAPA